ncbi:MAG: 50S ribosomal protein L11 methyltransferase [Gammaproteobacteria bacterium]|nr:50S ribosomal protein L11 methyltransferase [Gammaproteobacteria bacterium]
MTLTEYLEFSRLANNPDSNRIEALFMEAGACSITVEGADQQIHLEEEHCGSSWAIVKLSALFDPTVLNPESISRMESELAGFPLSDSLSFRELGVRNWDEEWKKHIRPITINGCLWIGPTWDKPGSEYQHAVHIDPGLAFGTGTHETTYLCLEALVNQDLEGASGVDFGCGTGILGIVSCILGAHCSIGVDIDPNAVAVANQNAMQNNVEKRFKACLLEEFLNAKEFRSTKYNVVVANILAKTLIEHSRTLKDLVADQGTLILSGILASQSQAVADLYRDEFEFSVFQRGNWVALIGIRQENESGDGNIL